ncbi:MAG: hypothetical protein K0M45_00740 [Candidatus Paracaedibacteraceae bacterium]|nr:hypothetical protein [Candidatus Paracaedibacteraceae bacterium]
MLNNSIKAYLSIISISFKEFLRNISLINGRLFFFTITIVLFYELWSAAYGVDGHKDNINISNMVWYIAMTECGVLSEPYLYSKIEKDIKSGAISYYLLRPISYISLRFYEGLGVFLINLPFFWLSGIIIASFLSYAPFQFSGYFFISYLLCIMSAILSLLIQLLIGLSAFWLGDVFGLALIYRKLLYVLGGLLLPLDIYPEIISKIAYFTPFPWMLYHRAKIIYTHSFEDAIKTFAMLLSWSLMCSIALYFFFKKCNRRIEINGG